MTRSLRYESLIGGRAFPTPHPGHEGMALRDWFAGQAVAGLLARGYAAAAPDFTDDVARVAYLIADAMIMECTTENEYTEDD